MTESIGNSYAGYGALSVTLETGVAWVTIDNPPVNLLDLALYPEMMRLVDELAADDAVRVVVLRSANPEFFIAHFDVSLIMMLPRDLPRPDTPNEFLQMCETLRTMPKPTIAMIEGRVGGGGSEMALSCDMRFAAIGRAVFNQPEVPLGIIPGGSSSTRLSRLAGRSRAMEIILSGDDFDALTAERYGWVNRALAPDDLEPFVRRLANRIASFQPQAVAAAKRLVVQAEGSLNDELCDVAAAFYGTLAYDETQAAMQRFLASGGQTREGELRLGDLAGEIA
jgi:enoyl-CoA hydratase/carnithine racemase